MPGRFEDKDEIFSQETRSPGRSSNLGSPKYYAGDMKTSVTFNVNTIAITENKKKKLLFIVGNEYFPDVALK